MTFDPKTALGQCDTLMLDMDGTVLDLGYDNYMWLEHIPGLWAAQNGVSPDQARDQLMGKFYSMQGDIRWYDLDHWSEYLGVDVKEAHRKERHRIDYLPGAKAFLEDVRASELRVLLVSNSHQMTLDLKDEETGLKEFFDGVHISHDYGHAKESQKFWHALREAEEFDPQTTMFVDDNPQVLASAATYGIRHPVAIRRPDLSQPEKSHDDYASVEGIFELR